MTREEMELLAALKQSCDQAPAFALKFPDNGLPVIDELEFGYRLLRIAQGILQHARQRGHGANDRQADADRNIDYSGHMRPS